jgi:hypothetical protein
MKLILKVSQHNINSFLLEVSVLCSRIAEELPTTSGTNPNGTNQKSLRLPHKTPLLLAYPLTSDLHQIPLAENKNSQRNMCTLGKDLLLF